MTWGELTSRANLRITDEMREKLDKIAKDRGVKISVVIRGFIEEGLWGLELLEHIEHVEGSQ